MRAMQRSCRNAIRSGFAFGLALATACAALAPAAAQTNDAGLVDDARDESPQFDDAPTWQAPRQFFDREGFELSDALRSPDGSTA